MKTSEKLIKVVEEFGQFENQKLTPENRKNLYDTIQKHVDSGLFVRKDQYKNVNLYTQGRYEHGMAPDITIGVSDGTIWICNDGFWGTICGINEQEQENAIYQRMTDLGQV